MIETEMCIDMDFFLKYASSDLIKEVNEFTKIYSVFPQNLNLQIDKQVQMFKHLGYNDNEIRIIREIDFKQISEKSISFYFITRVCIPHGEVVIKDIGSNGRRNRHVLNWLSNNRKKSANEKGMKISKALERELVPIYELQKLAEMWC